MLYRATEQWSVFGQYAAGFRAPDAGQVSGYYENAAEQVIIIPNPDLRPERAAAWKWACAGAWTA